MNNILLVFLNNLDNVEKFNKFIDKFVENNYIMYLWNNIKEDKNFAIDSLPELIEFYKSQHNNVNKVVILSNSKDLVFSWYRCYNALVDDYIYFIDEDSKSFFEPKDRHYEFYNKLSGFHGINEEKLGGVIFSSDDFNGKYLDDKHHNNINAFNYNDSNYKKRLNKRYILNGYEYVFDIDKDKDILKYETINLNADKVLIKNSCSLKIVLFKGQSQYDVLRIMLDSLVEEFIEQGHEVTVIDLSDKNCVYKLNQMIKTKYDLAFSFNGIGIDIQVNNNQLLLNAIDLPFITYMVDHPISHSSRINKHIDKIVYVFADEENIKYMNKNYHNKKNEFIPFMGIEGITNNISFKDREIEVLFAGSIKNPEEIKTEWTKYDNLTNALLFEIKDYFLFHEDKFLWDVIEEITSKYNNIIEDRFKFKRFLYVSIETYIRTEKRYELLKNIAESKINALCFTNNPKELKAINRHNTLKVKKQISFNELLKCAQNSKIVLNISAQASLGISERVLSTMINGAVGLTDSNPYINNSFKNHEEILLYNKNDLKHVPDIIQDALGDTNKLCDIAHNGNRKVKKEYSSKSFSIRILEIYEKHFL